MRNCKKALKYVCILYAIIGIILWTICFISTDWSNMQPLCCENCDKVWYSQIWYYYFLYTSPFIILTFPIAHLVYDIDNVLMQSIISIYLPLVPCLILLGFSIFMGSKSKKVVNCEEK